MKTLRAILCITALGLLPIWGDCIHIMPLWLSVLTAVVLLGMLAQGVGVECDD